MDFFQLLGRGTHFKNKEDINEFGIVEESPGLRGKSAFGCRTKEEVLSKLNFFSVKGLEGVISENLAINGVDHRHVITKNKKKRASSSFFIYKD